MARSRQDVPKKVKEQVKARTDYRCVVCGKQFPEYCLEVHHVKRRANGGSNQPSNLVPVCANCHRIIHAHD
jgi:5-methylcytosine-specific restriction endonuclease McrA